MIDDQYAYLYIKELAKELNADLENGSVRIHLDKKVVEIDLYPAVFVCPKPRLVIPARFEFKTSVASCPPFIVRKNDFIDCINEHILLRHDFQTGIEYFDKEYFIKVADEAWAHAFFTEQVISHISRILSGGFNRVHLSDGNLIISKDVKTVDDCPLNDAIEDIVQHLLFLAGQEAISEYRGKAHGGTEEDGSNSLLEQVEKSSVKQNDQTLVDFKLDISRSSFFYLCSMMFTPIALPIVLGISAYFITQSAGRDTYLFLLALPAVGSWFGYKGYISQQKITALLLCITVNAFYVIFLIYGILKLG